MNKFALAFMVIFFAHGIYASSDLEDLLTVKSIVVEKTYVDNGNVKFANCVGKFNIYAKENLVSLTLFETPGNNKLVVAGNYLYKITKLKIKNKNIHLECTGITIKEKELKGTVWLEENDFIRISMRSNFQNEEFHNLGDLGRKFLKDNNLEHLNLH